MDPDIILNSTNQEIITKQGIQNTGRLVHIWKSLASWGISTQAAHLLSHHGEDKTNNNYNSLFAKWVAGVNKGIEILVPTQPSRAADLP